MGRRYLVRWFGVWLAPPKTKISYFRPQDFIPHTSAVCFWELRGYSGTFRSAVGNKNGRKPTYLRGFRCPGCCYIATRGLGALRGVRGGETRFAGLGCGWRPQKQRFHTSDLRISYLIPLLYASGSFGGTLGPSGVLLVRKMEENLRIC